MLAQRSASLCRVHARSASSTTACSRTPSAAPSAGTATSPSGWPPTGHEVTYLTLRQWDRGERAERPGRARRRGRPADGALHARRAPAHRCRRSCSAPACSGTCCATARRYDVVHTASFPYFSLLAAGARAAAAAASGWWSTGTRSGRRDYWREYLGRVGGRDRLARCSALCVRVPQRAFCFSRAARRGGCARRACAARSRCSRASTPAPLEPRRAARRPSRVVVFAGRHIPEKRVPALVPAIAAARERAPGAARRDLRRRPRARGGARRAIASTGSTTSSTRPASSTRRARRARAAPARCAWCCPRGARATGWSSSRRPRAARRASSSPTPTTPRSSWSRRARTASSPPSAAPEDLAAAIVRVHAGGPALRESTARLVRAQRAAAVARRLARRRSPSAYARAARARSSRASARAVRSQVNAAARSPARAQRSALGRIAEQPLDRAGDRGRVVGVERAARRRPPPRAATRGPSRRPARRAPSPRAPAARSPRRATGTTNAGSQRVEALEVGLGEPAEEAHVVATPARPRTLAQLGLVRRRVAGQTSDGPALGGISASASSSAARFLCGRLADRQSTHAAGRRGRAARAARRAGVGAPGGRRPTPSGTTSTLRRVDLQQVATRSSRVDAASTMIRCERRAAAGTSTRMPSPRSPKWASGTMR